MNEFRSFGHSSSADLAWWESYLLQAYLPMFAATADTFWLDRFAAHADTMFAVMRDAPGSGACWPGYRDGFLGWGTTRYDPDRSYQEYLVHDGQICLPVARFIRLVFETPALQPRYLGRARAYLATVEQQVVAKWHANWHVDRGSGEALSGFGGWRLLPFNQALVFGELLLTLGAAVRSDIYDRQCPDVPLAFYSDTPDSIAAQFRRSLLYEPERDAWAWTYAPGSSTARRWEDLSHAGLDLSFAVSARGSAFSDSDLARFARTLTDVMWNGSNVQPWFSRYVNGSGGPDSTGNLAGWLRLAAVLPRVFHHVGRVMLADTSRLSPWQTSSAVALVTALLAEMQPRFPDETNPTATADGHAPPGARCPTSGTRIVADVLSVPVSPATTRASLFDMTGRKVMTLHSGPNDVSSLPPGVYFVRMADGVLRGAQSPALMTDARVIIRQ